MNTQPRISCLLGTLAFFGLALSPSAMSQIPPGFEVVEIRSSSLFNQHAQLNECGEVVYNLGRSWEPIAEVFLYDNGLTTQVTDNEHNDGLPDINDNGVLVWDCCGIALQVGGNNGNILIGNQSAATMIGSGFSAVINNLGHVAWKDFDFDAGVPCAPGGVFFWDGAKTTRLSPEDGLTNQGAAINNHDVVMWTAYDNSSCDVFWTSEIKRWQAGTTSVAPGKTEYRQGVDINDANIGVWGGVVDETKVIEKWAPSGVAVIIDDGINPQINNHGEIFFLRFHRDEYYGVWQTWLYRPGDPPEEIRLIDAPQWHTDGDINDYGECVWVYAHNPPQGILGGGIKYMRRIRNGDVTFDDNIDAADTADLPGCLTGPVDTPRLCDCRFYDIDHDRDVDLRDAATQFNRFGTVGVIARDCCTQHDSPGCNDAAIEACVCAEHPECCEEAWTTFCPVWVTLSGCAICE